MKEYIIIDSYTPFPFLQKLVYKFRHSYKKKTKKQSILPLRIILLLPAIQK